MRKLKSVILIALGVSLLIVGINMRAAKNTWDETSTSETTIPGTKGRNAVIGGVTGAVGGGTLAAVVGGIGIVVAGTGFGLPAGAALIATAAALGAGGGAIAGAATGRSSTTSTSEVTVTHIVPAYETWQWVLVSVVGLVLLLLALLEMRKLQSQQITDAEQAASPNGANRAVGAP